MKPVSRRVQSEPTTLLYAAVVGWASWLPYMRSQYELAHAADVDASGGMYAFGDMTLYLLVALVFMIPTAFLLWFVARFEAFYTAYCWLLLIVSLTAPAGLGLFFPGASETAKSFGLLGLLRLTVAPAVLVLIGISRLVARFARAQRLTAYAFLIEGATLATAVALVILVPLSPRR